MPDLHAKICGRAVPTTSTTAGLCAMSRSHLLSQIAGCSAMQALTKGQYSSQWPLLISAANVARGLATDTSSSSSDSSSSTAVQKQQEYPPLYAACVLERLPVRVGTDGPMETLNQQFQSSRTDQMYNGPHNCSEWATLPASIHSCCLVLVSNPPPASFQQPRIPLHNKHIPVPADCEGACPCR